MKAKIEPDLYVDPKPLTDEEKQRIHDYITAKKKTFETPRNSKAIKHSRLSSKVS